MIGQTLSHYRIIEKLGEGGMGVVYKAHDTKLDRMVALKFLPLHLTASETEQARFLQEAKAAAALNHPNVCSIIDIQEARGQHFIVMEYVEGVTLDRKAPVAKVDEAIAYAIQIGEALQAAHSKGIVHRDVKSENVMVTTDGRVKVMDFGLAKLRGSARLTRESSTVGTMAYMAPEQIQGGEADARSDIFSFGVILFEMLTAQTPFRGEHQAAMMYSILNEEPQALLSLRSDVPTDLDRIIRRALEKAPEDRYQHCDDMVSELRRLKKQTGPVPRPVSREERNPSTPSVRPRRRAIILTAGVLLIAALGVLLTVVLPKRGETIRSMAVLPFSNSSGTAEYLSDGFTESLINTLSKLPGIKMMSARSVFRFKGSDVDPQRAAQELHVDAVLTGRMIQRGDDLSISVELINAQDNTHIWGEQYNRGSSDLIALQTVISREIAHELNVNMTGDQQRRFAAPTARSVDAYQDYLRGRFALNKRNPGGFDKAIDYFHLAIRKDPSYAQAYAGLAETYALKASYFLIPSQVAADSVRLAARKALELDESIGEVHAALATSAEFAWDWKTAEREYKKCLELSPNFATGRQWYGEFIGSMGRLEEGLAEIIKAQELDPLAPVVYVAAAGNLNGLRRYDEAIVQLQKALDLDPHLFRAMQSLASAYLLKGMGADALREGRRAVAESDSSLEYVANLGYICAMTGHREEAEKILSRLQQRSKHEFVAPTFFALLYTGLGETDEAFSWLKRGLEVHDPAMESLKVDPTFDKLRSDRRFDDLLKKVGLLP